MKAAAARRVKAVLADLIDPDRILREIAALAYFDPREMFTEEGKLKQPGQWSDEVAAAVAAFPTVRGNLIKNDGQFDEVVNTRPWDKPKALEMLAKHRGLLLERVEVTGSLAIVDRITAGRKRVADARGK